MVLILSLTMLLATACGPVDSVLLMAGRSWLSLRNSTVALAVNVGLNLVLIPLYGIRGAAIAWSVAIVVRNLLPLVQVRDTSGCGRCPGPRGCVGLGAVACFGGVGALVGLTAWLLPVDVALLVVGTAVYAAGIWTWRDQLGLGAFHAAVRRRAARHARRSGSRRRA